MGFLSLDAFAGETLFFLEGAEAVRYGEDTMAAGFLSFDALVGETLFFLEGADAMRYGEDTIGAGFGLASTFFVDFVAKDLDLAGRGSGTIDADLLLALTILTSTFFAAF